jgi:DNA-directed RNA polymerase subunit K/omega
MDIDNDELYDYDNEDYEEEDYEEEIEEEEEENEEEFDESDEEDKKRVKIIEQKKEIKPVSRNIIIVPPEERITDNRLHKNEASFIISTRAEEISKHSTHFVKGDYGNAISIAYHELYSHRCPLKLRRQVGSSSKGDIIVEEWDVKTMILPNIPEM